MRIVFLFALVVPASAFAYLDPGGGSLFIQFLLASFLGIFIALRAYFTRVTMFFKKILSKKNSDQTS